MAVSRTPKAKGRINKLIVSMIIRVGISGAGVPSGKRCPSDFVVWFRNPVSTVANHNGIASAIFIESCVVGVNVYGNNPNRLTVSRRIINDIKIVDH